MSSKLPTGVGTRYNIGQRYILFGDLTMNNLTIYGLFTFLAVFNLIYLAAYKEKATFDPKISIKT